MQKKKLIPTILCGGAGSRLWPLSREQHPKPFIKLHNDNQSLLQKAFLRAALLDGVSDILTVTNRELFFKVQEEYLQIESEFDKHLHKSYVLEPLAKNTAAAIASAATFLSLEYDRESIMLILTADHLIANQTAFHDTVKKACLMAEQGAIVTFGISPSRPETGYGYIEAAGEDVLAFVEKPNQPTAEAYLASGRYLWNSGMFCATADTLLKAFSEYRPDILSAVQNTIAHSEFNHSNETFKLTLDAKLFSEVPEDSIDYAIMEKIDDAKVIACDIGWSDIGCWQSFSEMGTHDESNNKTNGHTIFKDSQNCTIQGNHRTVAAIGLRDLIIVDTDDALLVANKDHAQSVKEVYSELKSQNHHTHKYHKTVHRPWGTYTVLEEGDSFKIKRIVVKPGASLSLQMHHHRSEHWVVISGEASVVNNDALLLLRKNESTFIPAGNKHRLSNHAKVDLIIIEVQTGHYLGEDDIIRFDDVYGREARVEHLV